MVSRKLIVVFGFSSFILAAESSYANVVGTDAQNFNPITSGLDFVTVHSSETLKPGIVNLGLFLNFAVNTLPYYDATPQTRLNFNDTVTGLDLNAGLGLTKDWDIGLSLPQVLSQNVTDQSDARGEFASTGSTEVRMNTKYRLSGDDSGGFAVVASMNINRIENSPFTGSNPGPTIDLEGVADTTLSNGLAIAANIGYRLRNPGAQLTTSQIQPLKDQLIASAAASYYVPSVDSKVIGEIYGSLPAQSSTSYGDRSLTSLEALVGVKHDVSMNLALHAGAAAGLIRGVASPDWRVYTGLNYTFGPLWGSSASRAIEAPVQPPERNLVAVNRDTSESAVITERFRTQRILFDFDSDHMTGSFRPALEELAGHLAGGFKKLVVEGHTDSIGSSSYNERLSLKRANAIRRYLVNEFHVDGRKIETIGYGSRRPIADNGNYQGRQENRRVEFQITR